MSEDDLKISHLDLPAKPENLASLEIGSVVYLTGTIFTGREGLYERVVDQGQALPDGLVDISDTNFHCSPAATIQMYFKLATFSISACFIVSDSLSFKPSGTPT